jgi:hypothetical protein
MAEIWLLSAVAWLSMDSLRIWTLKCTKAAVRLKCPPLFYDGYIVTISFKRKNRPQWPSLPVTTTGQSTVSIQSQTQTLAMSHMTLVAGHWRHHGLMSQIVVAGCSGSLWRRAGARRGWPAWTEEGESQAILKGVILSWGPESGSSGSPWSVSDWKNQAVMCFFIMMFYALFILYIHYIHKLVLICFPSYSLSIFFLIFFGSFNCFHACYFEMIISNSITFFQRSCVLFKAARFESGFCMWTLMGHDGGSSMNILKQNIVYLWTFHSDLQNAVLFICQKICRDDSNKPRWRQ